MSALYEDLSLGLSELLGDCLLKMILYGSVARGTATKDSDIDIALILQRGLTDLEEDQLLDLVVELNLKYDVVLSLIDIDAQKLKSLSDVLPFYKNILQEGHVLWTAA